MKYWRLVPPVSGLAVLWLLGVSFAGSQANAQTKPMLAEEAFKNIQVLKGISAGDFMGTMGIMTTALGFDCESCHASAGTDNVKWELDTPRKFMARRMVTMVTNINQTSFGGRQVVTCYTCHRGRDRPVVTQPVDDIYSSPPLVMDDVFRQAEGAPAPGTIVDKYIQVVGGAQRVNSLTSISATGTSRFFGNFGGGGEVQFYAKAPDQRATIISYKDAPGRGDNSRTYDGRQGWMRVPLSILGEYALGGNELAGARVDAQLTFPAQIKTALTNLRTGAPTAINDIDVDVVQGDGPDGVTVSLFFDSKSGLLLRTVRYSRSPIGRISTQIDYDDYREVGGIKLPYKWEMAWLDGRDTIELRDVKINVPIDAAKFGRQAR